jgi:DNA-binding YbaB/EbfC family protein
MPFDLNALMQQAQALQERMQKAQEKLATISVTGSAGGGMVVVTANGKGELQKVQIDKQAVDPRDVPMLEDLVMAAVNGALKAAQEAAAAEGPLAGMPDLGGLAGMFPGGFPK